MDEICARSRQFLVYIKVCLNTPEKYLIKKKGRTSTQPTWLNMVCCFHIRVAFLLDFIITNIHEKQLVNKYREIFQILSLRSAYIQQTPRILDN